MNEVLSFLNNSEPASTQMVNELVQLINGDSAENTQLLK